MTPMKGLVFRRRGVLRAACASGLIAMAGCGGVDPLVSGDAEAADPTLAAPNAEATPIVPGSIEDSLARLDALGVLELGALYSTQTQHTWVPYGGIWSSSEVELSEAQIAARLETFVTRAEEAVASAGDVAVPDDADALCWGQGDMYCLTKDEHAADLAALDALEIVEVEGMVRDEATSTGACYSSWDDVSEDDCKRAYRLRAIVDATRDLPSREPPASEGEP